MVKKKSKNKIKMFAGKMSYEQYLKSYTGEMTKTYIKAPKEMIELFKTETIKKLSPAIAELVYKALCEKEQI